MIVLMQLLETAVFVIYVKTQRRQKMSNLEQKKLLATLLRVMSVAADRVAVPDELIAPVWTMPPAVEVRLRVEAVTAGTERD